MFYTDFATEPIGGSNPYYRCVHCKNSVPAINGTLKGHDPSCRYRLAKESGQEYRPYDES